MAQRVNIQQAESQIYKTLGSARQKGFRFWSRLQCHDSLSNMRDEVIDRLGGSTSAWWWGASFFALTAAVGFGIFAAYTYSTTLAGLLDPGNNGSSIYTIIGVSFSIVNIVCGHYIKEGFETNSITNKSSGSIWKTFVGMVGVICMGTFLYMLTSSATKLAGGQSHLPFVIVFTVIIEAILGTILITPCRYIKLLLVQICLWFNSKLIGYNARKCDQYYEEYRRYAESYNREESSGDGIEIVGQEDENNIRIAVLYFRGMEANDEENSNYVNSFDEFEDNEDPTSTNGQSLEGQINVNDQNGSTKGQDSFNEDDFRI